MNTLHHWFQSVCRSDHGSRSGLLRTVFLSALVGLATGAELGIIFFRNSATQLELGLAWDALWDGFESFDRRFGSGSFYVAINY